MNRLAALLAPLCLTLTACAAQKEDAGGDKIQVFLLVGQSNMVGHGRVEEGVGGKDGAQGSLRHMVVNNTADYGHLLKDPNNPATSAWAVRDDAWVWHNNDGPEYGDLTVGYGRSTINIGPEFGFGHVVGPAIDDQVLIVKACWGGKSLGKDFLPPSAADDPEPALEETS